MKLRDDLARILQKLPQTEVYKFCVFHEKYAPHLETIATGLYDRLEPADQARFLVWFLKRWGKIDLVNPLERSLYDSTIASTKAEQRPVIALGDIDYQLRDFKSQGHDFQLLCYDWVLGVHDVLYNQYEHADVVLEPGDVIIDAGAFVGDTAIYFHHKLQGQCEVHSFELLDENLALLLYNLRHNQVPDGRVVINKLALTDESGGQINVGSGASQGSVSVFGKASSGDVVQTISLDDYAMRMGLQKVDFIKMDIEGSEAMALRGARQTIAHFKPKLAICLYHKWDDVFTLPALIDAAGVDYSFHFKWVQLSDGWEAVLLAMPTARRKTPRPAAATHSPLLAEDALSIALSALGKAYITKWGQADTLWRQRQRADAAQSQSA